MKVQHETVKYFIEDALEEIDKILKGCEDKALDEVDLKVDLEHALHMFNCAYNAKFLTIKEVGELSQEEFAKNILPPKDIFQKSEDV